MGGWWGSTGWVEVRQRWAVQVEQYMLCNENGRARSNVIGWVASLKLLCPGAGVGGGGCRGKDGGVGWGLAVNAALP